MAEITKRVFFKVYHNSIFDDYGDFTEEQIDLFKANQEIIHKAINTIMEVTNNRITYLNIPILKQIIYTDTKNNPSCMRKYKEG